jgi:glycosyltransferase involved in cell wall biosynthesis
VVPQSVDTARFHPVPPEEKLALRRKLGLPEAGLLVMFSGRLVSYKGLPVLVRVWERLSKAHPAARLVLVGAGGVDIFNCEEDLRRFVAERKLEGSVHFTGAVRNVHEHLQAADVFAFPTENEAFPLALLEAMACGLPVVATTVGGIKDVVRDGANGLMIPPGREDALEAALQRLLADAALRAALGAGALATVQAHYTRDQVTAQYLALFREALAARGGRSSPP